MTKLQSISQSINIFVNVLIQIISVLIQIISVLIQMISVLIQMISVLHDYIILDRWSAVPYNAILKLLTRKLYK